MWLLLNLSSAARPGAMLWHLLGFAGMYGSIPNTLNRPWLRCYRINQCMFKGRYETECSILTCKEALQLPAICTSRESFFLSCLFQSIPGLIADILNIRMVYSFDLRGHFPLPEFVNDTYTYRWFKHVGRCHPSTIHPKLPIHTHCSANTFSVHSVYWVGKCYWNTSQQ